MYPQPTGYQIASKLDSLREELKAMGQAMERAAFIPDEIALEYDELSLECIALEQELIGMGWPVNEQQLKDNL